MLAPAETFPLLLSSLKPAIEERLTQLFGETRARWEKRGVEVASVIDAAASLTLRGGKRYRAGMLAAAYLGFAAEVDEIVLDAASSLELLQSYLLIQDDWMDGDVERRGGPSAHAALGARFQNADKGAAGGILASDLVWGMSVKLLSSCKASRKRRLKALELFCRVHEDVVVGQVLDSLANDVDIEVLHALKTGSYTVRGPILLGATLAGAGKKAKKALMQFAEPVGIAFQIRDDLIGVFGSGAEAGRIAASDLRAAKKTAVTKEAFYRMNADQKRVVEVVWGKQDASLDDLEQAASAIERCGAREMVEARLTSLCDQAERIASDLPMDERGRRLLAGGVAMLRSVPGRPA
jgi:geranylgeranyl diphosphate synthase, type I